MAKVEQSGPLTCFKAYDVRGNAGGLEQRIAVECGDCCMMIRRMGELR